MSNRVHHDYKTGECCKRPSVATMDYFSHTPDDWNRPQPKVNRVCLRCYTHWFGTPDAVTQYTRKEWDSYIGVAA